MSKKKYFDFDSAMKERHGENEPVVIKAFGKEYNLPAALPYDVILLVQRLHAEGKEVTDADDLNNLCSVIFGEEAYTDWRKQGITLDGMAVMIENVISLYMDTAAVEAEKSAESKRSKLENP